MVKIIDLFAGIGGFHLAFSRLGAKCVLASEIDEFARKTYEINFKSHNPELFDHHFVGDIRNLAASDVPEYDILCGGFPCQPFSGSGKQLGFADTRGTLFFEIARLLQENQPRAFFLENVKNLVSHDKGNTFKVIVSVLEELGYRVSWKVIKATDFGLPTFRPRTYLVGFKDHEFVFPNPIPLTMTMSDVLGGHCPREIGFTLRVGGKKSGIHDRHNWDCYLVDGKEHYLTVAEGKKMMGYPDEFSFSHQSDSHSFKQLGNSVAINVVQAIASEIIKVF